MFNAVLKNPASQIATESSQCEALMIEHLASEGNSFGWFS